ncbi:MAG TPA: 5'-nucleotidase C-terminal domain-containing protein [Nocardioidaceae bacterium]|nr:5'-nucleotidase C-terminal domain-containing protein [Nocardioidaceae bacterium]
MTALELLHWNDLHGRWAQLARLSARAREIRAKVSHPVILLDGGDIEEGSVELSALSKGVAGWRMLGAAGVDAAVVGNGGLLRYGPDVVADYAEGLGSPPLVCDLDLAGAPPPGAARSRIVEAGAWRVGVIGATDCYPQYALFGLVERGRVTAVRAEADRLHREGADVVVLLSHCGLDGDRSLSWHLRGKVDLIVGGHSHDVLESGDLDHGIPIVQAGCYGERLGRVRLDVDADGVQVVDVRHEVMAPHWPSDPKVLEAVATCEHDLADWLNEPVGSTETEVGHHETTDSAIARLLAAALVDQHPGDLGMVVAGHCTAGLPSGEVTRRDLWAATSSPGNAATATVSGTALRAMVLKGQSAEYATRTARTFRGRPYGSLHLAGAEVRAGELFVGDRPVDDTRTYRVTGSDLELSTYGLLVESEPGDLVVHVPTILPEILERYLAR